VILTIAGTSLFGGAIGLLGVQSVGYEKAAICCGVAFAVLGAAAFALRWVEATGDVRGTLAVVAVLFVPACFLFADDLANASVHDDLQKICIAAGLLTVAAAVTTVTLPSAVTGALATLALGTAIGSSVWLSWDVPTQLQITVATVCFGLFVVLGAPRAGWLALLRPLSWMHRLPAHPMVLGWVLGTASLILVGPGLGLLAVRNDGFTIAAAICGGFGLLLLAQVRRNLAIALGAFAIVATVEAVFITRYVRPAPGSSTTGTDAGTAATAALIVVGVAGVVLVALFSLLAHRRAARVPASLGHALLAAAFVLALISLFTVPGHEPGTPIVPTEVRNPFGIQEFGTQGPVYVFPSPPPGFEFTPPPGFEFTPPALPTPTR